MKDKAKTVSAKYIRYKTIVSFAFFALFICGCIATWKWIHQQPEDAGAPVPLRKMLNTNELIFGNFYSTAHLSRSFPVNKAVSKVRVNGDIGMDNDFDAGSWKLHLVKKPGDTVLITLDDIKKLPKTDVVFDFKCIEGWSQVTHWGGVRFSDFVKAYGLTEQAKLHFTSLVTPDEAYYVGIDNKSMLHPQTLLCYEMNGAPLPMNQGYPLRLIIPVKYGVKHLKRIGTISFSDQRPRDYWYERGYDYYCGL